MNKLGEMSTLYNSCNIQLVPKKPQLCFTGPKCDSNLAFSLENISQPLYEYYLLFLGMIFRLVGNIYQDKPLASQKMKWKYPILVL